MFLILARIVPNLVLNTTGYRIIRHILRLQSPTFEAKFDILDAPLGALGL